MKSKKNFQLKVPGTNFVIKSNTIYTLKPKPDPNAPDGFKKHGTTKVIHPEIGDTISMPFDTEMGVWDTGFYDYSPCLRGMDPQEREKFIEDVNEIIVKPVESIKGQDRLRHTADNQFFDEYVVTLANKMAFNTANPLELFGLYLSLLGKQICPSDQVGNPAYKHAAFQVVDREKQRSSEEESSINNSKAIGKFYMLLQTDKDKLLNIFDYLGISRTAILDEETFITVFNKYLEDKQDGYRNGKIFLEHVAKFSTEDGEEELNAYSMLNDLYKKGDAVKVVRKEFYLKEHNIGNTIKHGAAKVVNDKELYKLLIELAGEADTEEVED